MMGRRRGLSAPEFRKLRCQAFPDEGQDLRRSPGFLPVDREGYRQLHRHGHHSFFSERLNCIELRRKL